MVFPTGNNGITVVNILIRYFNREIYVHHHEDLILDSIAPQIITVEDIHTAFAILRLLNHASKQKKVPYLAYKTEDDGPPETPSKITYQKRCNS